MITPERAKRLLRVAKVIVPTVVPAVAPYAMQAAGVVRERFDRLRAHRLGIDVAELPAYTGRGAKLHVRIAGDARGLTELAGHDGQDEFAAAGLTTLSKLAAAVRAAEHMPAARRRAAHRAVAAELDRLEGELLRRLGA